MRFWTKILYFEAGPRIHASATFESQNVLKPEGLFFNIDATRFIRAASITVSSNSSRGIVRGLIGATLVLAHISVTALLARAYSTASYA